MVGDQSLVITNGRLLISGKISSRNLFPHPLGMVATITAIIRKKYASNGFSKMCSKLYTTDNSQTDDNFYNRKLLPRSISPS